MMWSSTFTYDSRQFVPKKYLLANALEPCASISLSHLNGAKIMNTYFFRVEFDWICSLSFRIWIKILHLSQLRRIRLRTCGGRGTGSRGVQFEHTNTLLTSHWVKYKSSSINPNNTPNRILIDAFQTDLLTKQTSILNINLTKSHFLVGAKTAPRSQSCQYTPISITHVRTEKNLIRLRGFRDKIAVFFTTPLSCNSQKRLEHRENHQILKNDQKVPATLEFKNIPNVGY